MRAAQLLRKYDPAEWGGTETAIHRMTAGLAGLGVQSIVYAPRLHSPAAAPDPLSDAGCVVRRFRARLPVWGISEDRRRRLTALGGNAISFDLPGALWREDSLDVIHSHALGRLGAIGRVVARRRGLPFVVSIHGGAYDLSASVLEALLRPAAGGWDWGRPIGMLLRSRHILAEADAIITMNPVEARLVAERHPGRLVFPCSHGVPSAVFARDCRTAARDAFPWLRGRPMLLVLGRIDATKNQHWAIAQFSELARRHPRTCMVLVGACTDAAYGAAIRTRIEKEGIQDRVLLAGSLPAGDPRLIGLLQEARAVVLPSLSETFGIVILEAWAAGTPVISSRTSGATAIVEEGVNGLLFDLDQPASFHAAVDRILGLPRLGAELGAAGRAKVEAEFDTSVLAGRMKGLYEQLIEGRRNALRHPARR